MNTDRLCLFCWLTFLLFTIFLLRFLGIDTVFERLVDLSLDCVNTLVVVLVVKRAAHLSVSERFSCISQFLQSDINLGPVGLFWTNGVKFDCSVKVFCTVLKLTQLQIGICSLYKVNLVGLLLRKFDSQGVLLDGIFEVVLLISLIACSLEHFNSCWKLFKEHVNQDIELFLKVFEVIHVVQILVPGFKKHFCVHVVLIHEWGDASSDGWSGSHDSASSSTGFGVFLLVDLSEHVDVMRHGVLDLLHFHDVLVREAFGLYPTNTGGNLHEL